MDATSSARSAPRAALRSLLRALPRRDVSPSPATGKHNLRSSTAITAPPLLYNCLLILFLLWLLLTQFLERTVVHRALAKCRWESWEPWPRDSESCEPFRAVLVADPQLMDSFSYPNRSRTIVSAQRKIVDNYLKRNFRFTNSVLQPHATIFLGDLFDGGRECPDSEWLGEYSRFLSIFPPDSHRRSVYSLPGNHDVGYGDGVNIAAWRRFQTYFGPASQVLQLGNHSIVLLDTVALSYYGSEVAEPARQVLEALAPEFPGELPRILLTHVPLYRDPVAQPCGPKRESQKPFPLVRGPQYQTVLDYELSQEILAKVRPVAVFAGDDHDACHIQQPFRSEGRLRIAEEYTVKSVSMAMGVEFPAVQLLSLYNPVSGNVAQEAQPTFRTKLCYMPAPFRALRAYYTVFGAGVALLVALVWVDKWPEKWRRKVVWLSVGSGIGSGVAGDDKKAVLPLHGWIPRGRGRAGEPLSGKQRAAIVGWNVLCYMVGCWGVLLWYYKSV